MYVNPVIGKLPVDKIGVDHIIKVTGCPAVGCGDGPVAQELEERTYLFEAMKPGRPLSTIAMLMLLRDLRGDPLLDHRPARKARARLLYDLFRD
jgi:hypothetical protein